MLVKVVRSPPNTAGPAARVLPAGTGSARDLVVATAGRPAVLSWQLINKDEDHACTQPSLVAHKRRKLELRAGLPSARGRTAPNTFVI
jgi:transposase